MSEQAPKVSVIIPTYNRCEKLQRALKSVFSQTLIEIEIIIVDDASTDQTGAYIKGMDDQRIRYIRHEANKRGPAARNTGIKAARASLVALLDDDDEWYPRKLELQVNKFKEVPSSVGLIYTGTEIYDEQKKCVQQINYPEHRGNVYKRVLVGTVFASNSVLIKKECFEKAGMFDEQLTSCQDWDMWMRIARDYEFDYVSEVLSKINMHGKQISSDFNALIPGRRRMVEKHWEEFQKYPDILVIHLKRLGKLNALNGTWAEAWGWFRKAIDVRRSEAIKIVAWLLLEFPFVRIFQMHHFKKYIP